MNPVIYTVNTMNTKPWQIPHVGLSSIIKNKKRKKKHNRLILRCSLNLVNIYDIDCIRYRYLLLDLNLMEELVLLLFFRIKLLNDILAQRLHVQLTLAQSYITLTPNPKIFPPTGEYSTLLPVSYGRQLPRQVQVSPHSLSQFFLCRQPERLSSSLSFTLFYTQC